MSTESTTTDTQSPGAQDPLRIAVVAGSTRPRRRAPMIARWVCAEPELRGARLDLVDLRDHDLPMLAEPVAAAFGEYAMPCTRRWAETVAGYDGFVLVSPEYNASTSAALKNALDHLYAEWNDKAVAFAGYGMSGGIRAVEHLRGITAELKMAGIPQALELAAGRVEEDGFRATDADLAARTAVLTDLVRWAGALRTLRRGEAAAAV